MNTYIKISILLSSCLFLLGNITAQTETLYIKGSHLGGEMTIKWFPANPEIWEKGNKTGYAIERTQVDTSGNAIGSPQRIASSIRPQNEAWFKANPDDYIQTIGLMLYDKQFQFESDSAFSSEKIRYDYLMVEAMHGLDEAASALGLSFTDEGMTDGLLYRYRVFISDITEGEIAMKTESGVYSNMDNVPEGLFDFNLVGGKSILEMSGKLTEKPLDFVPLMARAYGDSIVLRWGPNNVDLWNAANKQGYVIFRSEVIGQEATPPDSVGYVRAWAMEDIPPSITSDSMALVATQILHGEMSTRPENIYEGASLLTNRFGFALYAADRSQMAADILGLRFVDKNVEPEKVYLYSVYTGGSDFPMHGDVKEIANVKDIVLPPTGFYAEPRDNLIVLHWGKTANDQNFSSYIIERSDDDGGTWEKLNDAPLLIIEDASNPINEYTFTDSVEVNDKRYIYRLYGMDAFAEKSQPAEIFAFAEDQTPPPSTRIVADTVMLIEKIIEIEWEDLDEMPDDFAGYQILLGGQPQGAFDTISTLISPDTRTFAFSSDSTFDGTSAHYFKVLSLDQAGNTAESEPKYVHIPDLASPEPPQGLVAKINEDNIITLAWDHSKSKDTKGYRIYYSYHLEESFNVVDGIGLITQNYFEHELGNNMLLNDNIYYCVAAEDASFNLGELSEIVVLERPDKVPPLRPTMNPISSQDSTLLITWQASPSEDVWWYELKRRDYGGDTWIVMDTIMADSPLEFMDGNVEMDKIYEYSVRAMDDAELYSDYAPAREGKLSLDMTKIIIEDLKAKQTKEGISLNWDYEKPKHFPKDASSYEFQIFKSYGGKNVTKMATVSSDKTDFIDKDISKDALHNYAVMIVFNTGHTGKLSPIVSIKVE